MRHCTALCAASFFTTISSVFLPIKVLRNVSKISRVNACLYWNKKGFEPIVHQAVKAAIWRSKIFKPKIWPSSNSKEYFPKWFYPFFQLDIITTPSFLKMTRKNNFKFDVWTNEDFEWTLFQTFGEKILCQTYSAGSIEIGR